jgi:hypothetical protein
MGKETWCSHLLKKKIQKILRVKMMMVMVNLINLRIKVMMKMTKIQMMLLRELQLKEELVLQELGAQKLLLSKHRSLRQVNLKGKNLQVSQKRIRRSQLQSIK